MTDASGQQISLDADVLEGTSDGLQLTYQTTDGQSVTTLASDNAADIVSKAFTTMADGNEQNVEYITMTPEEAAAAGVVANAEEEQVVTTSLQFDPANPSVLYTADGTPINQADLTPEEQELVQAALQQHLAEQEAEQQLSLMQQQQSETSQTHAEVSQAVIGQTSEGEMVTSTSLIDQQAVNGTAVMASVAEATDATVSSSGDMTQDGINLSSPTTSASQIVQSLADSVRKQQLQDQIHRDPVAKPIVTPKSTMRGGEGSLAGGIKYEEKIVIRQGQPQVVKIPVKRKPEIPAALANLMPKVEIGKDGSQVIRIHQSQITPGQLKALQENPNVRLVFRPAASTRGAAAKQPVMKPKKRGRPPKSQTQQEPSARINSAAVEDEPTLDDPPAKTRCGRLSKRPVYTRDYLTPKLSQGMEEEEDQIVDPVDDNFLPKSSFPPSPKRPRGRPPGNKTANKRSGSYASKIEALRNQDNNDAQIVPSSKPALTPIEQAISTRRKNRLREMLSACSQDEIMEVAMPHLARVFSLWEFLITKVEKNKMTRVFFADVYKEYECLHKYVSKLAEKYKQAIESDKPESETAEASSESSAEKKEEGEEKKEEEGKETEEKKTEEKDDKGEKDEAAKPKVVTVTCKKLAESLGIETTTLVDAEIQLLDPEEAIGPRLIGKAPSGVRRVGHTLKFENKNMKAKSFMAPVAEQQKLTKQKENKPDAVLSKPVQTEATSTIPQSHSPTKTTIMPPLKPLGQTVMKTAKDTADSNTSQTTDATAVNSTATEEKEPATENVAMDTEGTAPASAEGIQSEAGGETSTGTGTQLIQIGQGDDQQFIEVPEGYTLIQTPEGLVMSQPGTTISQGEDGTIYVTHADGTTTPLNAAQQQGVPMETVESLLSLEGQKGQG